MLDTEWRGTCRVDHTLLPILYFFESLEVQMKPTIVTGAVEAQQVAFQVAFPVG